MKPVRLSEPDGAHNLWVRVAGGKTEKSGYDKRQARPTGVADEVSVDHSPVFRRLSGLRSGAAVVADVEQYLAGWLAARRTISGAAAWHADNRKQRRQVLSATREA